MNLVEASEVRDKLLALRSSLVASPVRLRSFLILVATFAAACGRDSSLDRWRDLQSLVHRVDVMEKTLDAAGQRKLAATEAERRRLEPPPETPTLEILDCTRKSSIEFLEIRNTFGEPHRDTKYLRWTTAMRVRSETEQSGELTVDYLNENGLVVCQSRLSRRVPAGVSDLDASCSHVAEVAPAIARTEASFFRYADQ